MIDKLFEDYKRLPARLGLPKLERVWVLVRSEPLTKSEVEAKASELEQAEGWLRRQSRVRRTGPGEAGFRPGDGLPLTGEWSLPPNGSAHLRQDGRGGWRLYRYYEFETKDGAEAARRTADGGEGEGVCHSCLKEQTAVLGEDGGKLAYCVYWGGEGANIQRLFARFAGFRPDEDQEKGHRS